MAVRFRNIFAVSVVVALAACAVPPTPYRSAADGLGYSEQQIDSATWRVQFSGNSATAREQVEDYLLYRAAEVMRDGGYDKFVLLEKTIEPEVRYWGGAYGPAVGIGVADRRQFGHWTYAPAHYAPQTRYKGSALIRVYRSGDGGGPVFSAKALIAQIGPRIDWPKG